jgi:hypothetical protein
MCKKPKGLHNRIDPCIRPLIKWLKQRGFETKGSCCGHSKYPMTIVVKSITSGNHYELFSKRNIPRTRNFYKKDKNGIYYIPEVLSIKNTK